MLALGLYAQHFDLATQQVRFMHDGSIHLSQGWLLLLFLEHTWWQYFWNHTSTLFFCDLVFVFKHFVTKQSLLTGCSRGACTSCSWFTRRAWRLPASAPTYYAVTDYCAGETSIVISAAPVLATLAFGGHSCQFNGLPTLWISGKFVLVSVHFLHLNCFPILHLTTMHKDPKSSLEFLWAFISLTNRVLESWGSFFRAQILKEAATFWNFSLCYTVFYPVPVLQRPSTFASATGWW